jgi:ABC-2 type transport system permease protein
MTGFIFALTLRQLLTRRSTLLLLGLAMLPVLVAMVYRLSSTGEDPERFMVRVVGVWLVLTTVLPLTAVLFGTSVLGDELEDGTAVYLLTKPIPRWQILLPKVAAAWLMTSAFGITSVLVAAALTGAGESQTIAGIAAALALGALAYCTLFAMLSLVTTHALIAGLVFVFIWEGAMGGIFEGVRYLSIRQHALGLAEWLGGFPTSYYDAYVGGSTALILIVIAASVSFAVANRRLQRAEIREPA